MAGEPLESTLIINDEASKVLETIAKQSETAESALADVQQAMDSIEAIGNVAISADVNIDDMPNMANINKEAIKELEKALSESDSIDLSVLEEANERNEKSWQRVLDEIEEEAAKIFDEWEDAEKGIVEIPKDAQKEAEKTGKDLKKGVRGLGADIAGWWTLIKDVFSKIADVFGKLAEESDKLNTRIARFGLVADVEGKTGAARGERSGELYKQHQKFAQALGVQSEAFNETVLNMYSNGAGVVKSIEEAQTIAASSYMAMDIAGLRGRNKDAVMGEVQSMVSVGIADPDQIQESMKIAPNILRTIEKQWEKNQKGKAFKLNNGEEITDATGKIAQLAQEGQITADLVAQAMVNSAKETNQTWQTLPSTWEKLKNRISVITENMVFDILEQVGKLADDPQVADFVMSALELGEKIIKFTKDYILPVVGGALRAIASVLTTVFQTLSHWETAVPILISVGAVLASVAVKAGLLTKAIAGIKVAMAALAANPFILVAGGIMIAALAIAHLVRTTQTGQEIMLEVTAALSLAGQQVAAFFCNLPDIIKSAFRGLLSYLLEFGDWLLGWVAGLLEKVGSVSDTAKEAAESLKAKVAQNEAIRVQWDAQSEEKKKGWMGDFEANKAFYDDYRKRIPDIAAQNLAKNKDDLKLTGFLEKILDGQQHAPGTTNNPANVKGKVAIDGEYFDVIKRAAGVEIVNRYTTLRPTVNARFGDIHQIDAQDILGELGRTIQDAEGAAISDAQALGA